MTGRTKIYLGLHLLLVLFSLVPVLSKLAGRYPVLSRPFLLYYGGALAILALYALFWQQVIKRMPLSAAYANKAVMVVWGMVWGVLFFSERITAQKLVGAAVIIAGVVGYALCGGQEGEPEDE